MKIFGFVLMTTLAAASGAAMAQTADQAPPGSVDTNDSEQDYDEQDDIEAQSAPPIAEAPQDVDQGTFEASLSPYGAWVTVAGIGRVWRPYPTVVGNEFQPYSSNGSWVYTDVGWTWVSEWDWGWAPFHYGRWWLDDYYGWVWMPGYTWGPAWVSWRWGGGYIGWEPLTPWGYHYRRHYWGRTWCFVDDGHFTSSGVGRHRHAGAEVEVFRARTAPSHARSGPPVGNVAHATGTPVRALSLSQSGALPVANAMRPRPVTPGGSGGAGPIRTPGQPSNNAARPEAIRTDTSQMARPTYQPPPARLEERPTYQPPSRSVERPSYSPPPSRPVERPTYQPPSRPVERPSYSPPPSRPSPSYSSPPSRPSYSPPPSAPAPSRPSSINRPSASPTISAPVAHPSASGGGKKK